MISNGCASSLFTLPRAPTWSCSAKVFFLLKENELTPSGANLLDGRFAVFGYVTEGADLLGSFKVRRVWQCAFSRLHASDCTRCCCNRAAGVHVLHCDESTLLTLQNRARAPVLQVGDKIEFIKFVDGVENLKNA